MKFDTRYNDCAATHNYITGYTFRGRVRFMVWMDTCELAGAYSDRESSRNGGGMVCRWNANTELKFNWNAEAVDLCSVEEFNRLCAETHVNKAGKTCKWNKGEIFEKLVTEYYGQTWAKDTVKWWEGVDLTVNGIGYSIKFEKATIYREAQLG